MCSEQDFDSFQDLLEFVLALQQQIPLNTTPASFVEQLRNEFSAERDSAYSSSITGSSIGSAIAAPSISNRSDAFTLSSVASSGRNDGGSTASSGYSSALSSGFSSSGSSTCSSLNRPLRPSQPQQLQLVPEERSTRGPGNFRREAGMLQQSAPATSSRTEARWDSNSSRQSTQSTGSGTASLQPAATSSTSQSAPGTRGYQSLQTPPSSTLSSRGSSLIYCTLQLLSFEFTHSYAYIIYMNNCTILRPCS